MANHIFEQAPKGKGAILHLPVGLWNRKNKAEMGFDAPPVISVNNELEALRAENEALRQTLVQTQHIQGATLERFRTTFYEMPLPAFTVNDEGLVMEWNRAAALFFDRAEPEVVDKPIASILGTQIFRQDAEGMVFMVFLGMTPDPIELEIKMESGETRRVKWFASPIKNRAGQVVGALNTLGVLPRFESVTG